MTSHRLLPMGVLFAAILVVGCGGDDSGVTASRPECMTVVASIGEFVFDPTPVVIRTCDSVIWENTHTQAHTSTGNGTKTWGTGNVQPGARSEPVVFADSGSFTYICALHPFMQGAVEVQGGS